MGKFARSWALMKASAGVLRSDKSLLVFPLLSGICSLVVMASFLIPVASMTMEGERLGVHYRHGLSTASWTLLFGFYLVQYFVIFFFNTALAGVALKRLRGEEASVSEGLALAGSRIGAIFGYALIAATVGLLLRMVQERLGLIGRFIVGLIGLAWTVATFLVVPVLAGEGVGPVDAVKRSVELLRRTWGENLIGNAGLSVVFGLIGFLLALVSVALVVGAFATQSIVAGVTAVAIVVSAFIVLALVQSSLQGVYAAALYRYAEEGEAGAGFPPALLEQAFRPKG
ncbi:hypothetical protein ATSB10_25550 [Dyella thiooxydans]|uniref:Glycerophosphoryl diester phosphodiesterase membrane domain-containing protein n=1 Tax=Dyella thiooxydans TaxID=445710 RepID=A0A161J7R1_9GAMM|nr:DUF6159 family protein [Dyella thiooxydans]AND70009.1 hypothetical protein ATSB10_25550 [Dyella thiooxydans]